MVAASQCDHRESVLVRRHRCPRVRRTGPRYRVVAANLKAGSAADPGWPATRRSAATSRRCRCGLQLRGPGPAPSAPSLRRRAFRFAGHKQPQLAFVVAVEPQAQALRAVRRCIRASTGTGSPATDAAKAAAGGQPTGAPPQPAPMTQQLANTPLAAQPSVPAPPPAPAPAPEAPAPPPSAPTPSGGAAPAHTLRHRHLPSAPPQAPARRPRRRCRWDRRPHLLRRHPCLLPVPPRPRRWGPASRPPPRPA